MKTALQTLYLDYVNNFLTVAGFADWHHFEDDYALRVIQIGKKVHVREVERQLLKEYENRHFNMA